MGLIHCHIQINNINDITSFNSSNKILKKCKDQNSHSERTLLSKRDIDFFLKRAIL